ncbi:alpha/beta hydrolase [Embleya sp. NPDC127516]|uniref:alpha/beta hydrolase n=1 Tax=Embleya sp. NPDC127516 TaxID=3363990 RepID=UPI0038173B03
MPTVPDTLIALGLRVGFKPLTRSVVPLPLQRAVVELVGRFIPRTPGTRSRRTSLAALDTLCVSPPRPRTDLAVLHYHGGGFCTGSPAGEEALATHLARATGAVVYLPGYRRAPEHPYPAAEHDALAAYHALADQSPRPTGIVVSGSSAGGALALATARRLCAERRTPPVAVVLLSPWLDLTLSGESMSRVGRRDPFLTRSSLVAAATLYRPNARLRADASPLFADLAGLPPLIVHSGRREILLSDAERLAVAARRQGVPVVHRTFDGMWHVFHLFAALSPTAARGMAILAADIADATDV